MNFKNKNMMNIDVVKIQQKIKTLNIWGVHSSHHHHQSSYRFSGLIRDKGFIATWARDFFQNIFAMFYDCLENILKKKILAQIVLQIHHKYYFQNSTTIDNLKTIFTKNEWKLHSKCPERDTLANYYTIFSTFWAPTSTWKL